MTVADQPAPASAAATASDAPPPAPRRGLVGKLLIGLVLLGVVVVLVGGAMYWAVQPGATDEQVTAAGPPTAPELPAAPPPFAPVLATAAADTAAPLAELEAQLLRLPEVTTALAPQFAAAPFTPSAPASLVIPAGGKPTDVANTQIPRHERWEIQFPAGNSLESYIRQMEFFKIEIGLVGGSDQIIYLSNLADEKPKVRQGPAASENRLYLVWQRGPMREADEQLAARANVSLAGKVVAHFCPAELEAQLARLEETFARQVGNQSIRKTVFGMRATGQEGFRLSVLEQQADAR